MPVRSDDAEVQQVRNNMRALAHFEKGKKIMDEMSEADLGTDGMKEIKDAIEPQIASLKETLNKVDTAKMPLCEKLLVVSLESVGPSESDALRFWPEALITTGRFGINDHEKDARVLALLRCLAVLDQNLARNAQQVIGMMHEVGHNNTGFAPTLIDPVLAGFIAFSALAALAIGVGHAHRRPRGFFPAPLEELWRSCSCARSQARTVSRR